MKTIVVEFRNAYNIGILPRLQRINDYNYFDIKSYILE